jgi:acetyl esterase
MAATKATPPGRLGDPSMSLNTDPRMNPQLLAGMSIFGGGDLLTPPPLAADASLQEVLEYMAQTNDGTQKLYDVSIDNGMS